MAMGELMHIPVHSSFLPSLDRLALSGTIDRIISLKSKKKVDWKKPSIAGSRSEIEGSKLIALMI